MSQKPKAQKRLWIFFSILIALLAGIIWLQVKRISELRVKTVSIDSPEVLQSVNESQTKILVIGIDGLNWGVILNLVGEGRLPHFQKLIEQGARGIMLSEEPMISPSLWTTFATGLSRKEHKIDNFTFKPSGSYETEIMDSRVREAPALWEILTHFRKKVAVINWNAGSPSEPINGIFLADGVNLERLNAEYVYPFEWIDRLKNLDLIKIKWFEKKLDKWHHSVPSNGYQEEKFILCSALEILKEEKPDLLMVYFRNVDVVSHLFWKYRYPVGLEYQYPVSEKEREQWGDVIDSYYQLMDEFVGKLLDESQGYTVIVLSDHGFSATYPPKNIYLEVNLLLNQLGYLEYKLPQCEDLISEMAEQGLYQTSDLLRERFFICEFLRHNFSPPRLKDKKQLEDFLIANGKIPEEKLEKASLVMDKLFQVLSHPKLGSQIEWSRTKLFNLEDFHKIERGIYLNLKNREPKGTIELKDYDKFRKQVIKLLQKIENEKGDKLFKTVRANPAKKKPIPEGVIDPADILVEFNPDVLYGQYLFKGEKDSSPIYLSSILWVYSDGSGDHHPEGVVIISGDEVTPGKTSTDIYNIAPTILWLMGLPIGKDMPGKVLECFKAQKPVLYVESYSGKIKIPVSYKRKEVSDEEKEKLKAVGYIK